MAENFYDSTDSQYENGEDSNNEGGFSLVESVLETEDNIEMQIERMRKLQKRRTTMDKLLSTLPNLVWNGIANNFPRLTLKDYKETL